MLKKNNSANNTVVIVSEYTEQVTSVVQDKVSEVLKTTLDQLSQEYKRDITASIVVDVK